MNKPAITSRLARWLLLLQEFDITIIDKSGKSNIVVDYLSRLTIVDKGPTPIEDTFPNEHLFHITTHIPWYADIANYLATSRLPPQFSYKEKRKLAEKSFQYSWIDENLFYVGPNEVMRMCVRGDEIYDILHVFHDEPCEFQFSGKIIALKILTTRYYWPTLHKDAVTYTTNCDKCQRMG